MSGGGFGGCVIALCEPDSPALDLETHAPRGPGGSARLPGRRSGQS